MYYFAYSVFLQSYRLNSLVHGFFFSSFSGAKWKNTWEPAESFISYKNGKKKGGKKDKQKWTVEWHWLNCVKVNWHIKWECWWIYGVLQILPKLYHGMHYSTDMVLHACYCCVKTFYSTFWPNYPIGLLFANFCKQISLSKCRTACPSF